MVLFLLLVFNLIHVGSCLRLRHDVYILLVLLQLLSPHPLVVLENLKDILTDYETKLLLDIFREMVSDVPGVVDHFGHGLLDASVVVHVLEEKNAPVLLWRQAQVFEQICFLNSLNRKVDHVFRLVQGVFPCVNHDFLEVSVDNVAAENFQAVKELEEVLLHQLMY